MAEETGKIVAEQQLPFISVVVIGRNEGPRLIRCLESVRAADYPQEKIERIYVDSDSADDSCANAERLGFNVIRAHSDHPCAAAARNAGLQACAHELVQFLDGDSVLCAPWLRAAVRVMEDPTVTCVFGQLAELDPSATIYNFWAHHDWYIAPGRAESFGGNTMMRRQVLLEAGGFDSTLAAGEEQELAYRLSRDHGASFLCLDELMAHHDINMTRFSQYWRRCRRAGRGYAELSQRLPGLRRYRRACRGNLAHVLTACLAIGLSIALRSPWPAAIWLGLLALAIIRNALRLRFRVGTLRHAFLFSAHHYLAKVPATWGQCSFWMRSLVGHSQRKLVEHRR